MIKQLRESGLSYFKISDYLNEKGIKSKENKIWYGSSVRSVYQNNILNLL